MKRSLSTSLALHAAVIGFALVTLSSPRPHEAIDVDPLPVDLVSVEEFAQIKRGDRKSPVSEKPAPVPTKRPDIVEDAVNIGDNKADLDNAPTPEPRPQKVENPAARSEPAPVPVPAPKEEPVREAKAEPTPSAPAPKPEPEARPRETAAPEPAPVATPEPKESVSLPETAPVPVPRPKIENERQTPREEQKRPVAAENPRREQARRPDPQESNFDDDQVAALINRAKASGGGARQSQDQAALGNRQDSNAAKLSQGELDALRSQLESCWSPPVGAVGSSEFTASVKFQVDVNRKLNGRPTIIRSSGNRQFDDSVLRAVLICNDRGFRLPEGKQSVWADIIVNFDPRDMF